MKTTVANIKQTGRRFHNNNITPDFNDGKHVFVFGSNLAGRHGKGAALEAKRHWGAVEGNGIWRNGQAYAIPTKDDRLKTLPLGAIATSVAFFLEHARLDSNTTYLVTAIGTGLAGYRHDDIAPMFKDAPMNCVLPVDWLPWTGC